MPLVFGALGGVLGERAGVVNIAIDGQLLAGAFAAAIVGSVTGSPWAGVLGAMLAGALVALSWASSRSPTSSTRSSSASCSTCWSSASPASCSPRCWPPTPAALNSPPRLSGVAVPVLGEIPLLGPILFRQSPIVYLLYVAVAAVTWALYRTRWGLRVRAVGEHPKAADTVGINVNRTRYRTVLLAGRDRRSGRRLLHAGLGAGRSTAR